MDKEYFKILIEKYLDKRFDGRSQGIVRVDKK